MKIYFSIFCWNIILLNIEFVRIIFFIIVVVYFKDNGDNDYYLNKEFYYLYCR